MKKKALFVVIALGLIFAGNLWAYEGGTKWVAALSHPEKGKVGASALPASSAYGLSGTKLVVQFLYRMPEPTLSLGRIREETLGPSLGTKSIVLFQER